MTAIGVDFGYSAIRVALCSDTKEEDFLVDIAKNDLENRKIPTVVAFNEETRLVGFDAINHAASSPEDTVFGLKRLIGRQFNQSLYTSKRYAFNYEVIDGRLMIQLPDSKDSKKLFTTEQLLALLFWKLKESLECEERNFSKIVVSIPTYFKKYHKQSILDAAAIAGIEGVDFINDTTAIAISYLWDNFGRKESENCRLFILHLGSSSFETSLVDICDNEVEVLSTCGSLNLGGSDFDDRLVGLCIEKFKEQYNRDVSEDKKLIHSLQFECEKAKIALQIESEFLVTIKVCDEDLVASITREEFEKISYDSFAFIRRSVKKLFQDVGCNKEEVNEIILAGGASRMRTIAEFLTDFFSGKQPNSEVNIDEAVVKGAAICAAIFSGVNNEKVNDIKIGGGNHSFEIITEDIDTNESNTTEMYKNLSQEEINELKDELNSYKESIRKELQRNEAQCKCIADENEKMDARNGMILESQKLEKLLLERHKSRLPKSIEEFIQRIITETQEWQSNNENATKDQFLEKGTFLRKQLLTINESIKKENDRIAAKNELYCKLLNFCQRFYGPNEDKFKKPDLEDLKLQTKSLFEWHENNETATEEMLTEKIQIINNLKETALTKMKEKEMENGCIIV